MTKLNHRNRIALIAVIMLLAACLLLYLLLSGSSSHTGKSLAEQLGITKPSGDFRLWINSFPEGADVLLDDSLAGQTPLSLTELKGGQYNVSIYSKGFQAVDTLIIVPDEGSVGLPPFVLNRPIRLESIPTGAVIKLNESIGTDVTPMDILQPASDTFTLTLIHADLGEIWLSAVDPRDGTAIAPLGQRWQIDNGDTLVLRGRFSKVCTIRTAPTAAQIYYRDNDSLIGFTGQQLELPCGVNDYLLVKDGFDTLTLTFDPCASVISEEPYEMTRVLHVSAVSFGAPDVGDIHATITTLQSGSTAKSTNRDTPTDLELSGVEYKLCLQAEGYVDTCVVVSAGQTVIRIAMKRYEIVPDVSGTAPDSDFGRVEFVVHDKKTKSRLSNVDIIARIKSEDRTVLLGVTDSTGYFSVDLAAGKYEFRLVKEGYKQVKKKHTVKRNENKKYDIALKLK